MKTRKGGNKSGDSVRSQPEFTDVELRRIGEAMEMVCGVWFPTATFGTGRINGWIESVLIAVQGFAIP